MRTIKGTEEGPFLYTSKPKMNISEIKDAISGPVVARGCFLVDLKVSKDNEIIITIESEEGVVDLADCEAINDTFTAAFDRDVEDYALTVSSAGLDQPFKILKQYIKAVGTQVEVALKGGKKMVATLVAADEEGITLKYSAKEAVEGSKKKVMVEHEDRYSFAEVNSVTPFVVFE